MQEHNISLELSFERLYKDFFDTVFAVCMNVVKDSEDAQDLTHDILIKVYNKRHFFRGDSKLSTWVISIAKNHCIDMFRRKRNQEFSSDWENIDVQDDISDDDALENHLIDEMMKSLDQLSELERTLVYKKYFDRASIKEIQTICGLGESAIKMKLKRAREKMNKIIIHELDQ